MDEMTVEPQQGGMRPTAPQNNFAVSATGGAGNGGQPARYTAGIDNAQDFYDLQTAQPMSKSGVKLSPSSARTMMTPQSQMTPLDAPTQFPNEDVRTGVDTGPATGAGPEVMYATDTTAQEEDANRLRAALPYMAQLAEMPSASNSYRNYVRYLKSIL